MESSPVPFDQASLSSLQKKKKKNSSNFQENTWNRATVGNSLEDGKAKHDACNFPSHLLLIYKSNDVVRRLENVPSTGLLRLSSA